MTTHYGALTRPSGRRNTASAERRPSRYSLGAAQRKAARAKHRDRTVQERTGPTYNVMRKAVVALHSIAGSAEAAQPRQAFSGRSPRSLSVASSQFHSNAPRPSALRCGISECTASQPPKGGIKPPEGGFHDRGGAHRSDLDGAHVLVVRELRCTVPQDLVTLECAHAVVRSS